MAATIAEACMSTTITMRLWKVRCPLSDQWPESADAHYRGEPQHQCAWIGAAGLRPTELDAVALDGEIRYGAEQLDARRRYAVRMPIPAMGLLDGQSPHAEFRLHRRDPHRSCLH